MQNDSKMNLQTCEYLLTINLLKENSQIIVKKEGVQYKVREPDFI